MLIHILTSKAFRKQSQALIWRWPEHTSRVWWCMAHLLLSESNWRRPGHRCLLEPQVSLPSGEPVDRPVQMSACLSPSQLPHLLHSLCMLSGSHLL